MTSKARNGDNLHCLVGDAVNLGDWRLIEDRFPGKVIAQHENGSIRVRLEDGRELDGWPERTKPIPNDLSHTSAIADSVHSQVGQGGQDAC